MSSEPLSVLLVEDDRDNAETVRRLLVADSVWPCQVTHSESSTNAQQALSQQPYQLIFLDLSLPDAAGLAAFSALAAHSPHVPIVLLAESAEQALAEQAVREGAQEYLVKEQITRDLLVRTMRYAIERKRIEEALQLERTLLSQRVEERTAELASAVTQLQRAAHLRNEFLAKVSHELRTPLSIVLLNVDLITKGLYGAVTPQQSSALDRIRGGGKQLLHLIDELLSVAEIDSGRLELRPRLLSAQALCEACLQRVKTAATVKQIQIRADIDETPIQFVGDAQRLEQVLYNLLDNAIKFTPEGGNVGLSMEANRDEETILFSVWDSGIGIPKKDQERIFEPFVQLEETLTRQHAGAGLGLAVVKDVVTLHGGRVVLESEPGIGSWFTIVLPWREELPPA